MPFAPPRLCGCGNIVASGERCACQKAADTARKDRFDRRRPSSAARGYNGDWRRERAVYLRSHPRCAICGALATTVDHVIAHKGNDALFWDRTNWQSLCTHHHNSTKQREERRPVTP